MNLTDFYIDTILICIFDGHKVDPNSVKSMGYNGCEADFGCCQRCGALVEKFFEEEE